ncbi:MAG: hypothetical protein WAL80_01230 [Xanthobacteraceae bacterium]|jgi:hypothetical protein
MKWNNGVPSAVVTARAFQDRANFHNMAKANPMEMWNSWFALSSQAAMLGLEAQGVIALRMMRLAAGGATGQAEAQRMMTEKFDAFGEAHAAAVSGALAGGSSHGIGKKVLGIYSKRVRANQRRLAR